MLYLAIVELFGQFFQLRIVHRLLHPGRPALLSILLL
jgi:hypothetical protein